MKRGYCVSTWVVVSVLMLLTVSSPAAGQTSWSDLLQPIMSMLTSLWQNKELEFMGNNCFFYQRPLLREWQLYYEGTLSCPSWNSITGKAHTRSRSGVMTNTFKDYLNKVKASGLVSEEEASAWLKSHHGEEGEGEVFEREEEGLKKRGSARLKSHRGEEGESEVFEEEEEGLKKRVRAWSLG